MNNSNVTPNIHDITPTVKYWVYTLCIPAVALPGIFVSFVSCIIFSRKSMRSSLNVCLAGLSAFDCILLLMALMIYPAMVQCGASGDYHGLWCKWFFSTACVAFPLSLIAQFGSVWTCVLLTVDRFLAVKYPLHSRGWCTPERALICLCILSVCAVGYCSPTMFELTHTDEGILIPTELRNNQLYIEIYHLWSYLFFLFLIPWTIMLILNTVVAVEVRAAYKARKTMSVTTRCRSSKEEREHRSTLIATVIIVSFLFFNTIPFLNHCLEVFAGEGLPGSLHYTLRRLLIFAGNLFVCVNSASNFFIYSLGSRFRRQFLILICRCVAPAERRLTLDNFSATYKSFRSVKSFRRKSFEPDFMNGAQRRSISQDDIGLRRNHLRPPQNSDFRRLSNFEEMPTERDAS